MSSSLHHLTINSENSNFTAPRCKHLTDQNWPRTSLKKYECTIDQERTGASGDAACAHTRWQHFSAWNDVMAAIVKVWRRVENPTPSISAYLLEEQSCQITSRSDLKRRSLRRFLKSSFQQEEEQQDNNKKMSRDIYPYSLVSSWSENNI